MTRIIRTTGDPFGVRETSVTGGSAVIICTAPSPDPAEQQRAMLRTVSLDLLVQECARRGHQVCLHTICRLSRDALPPGYPPWADGDLPFDAERDGL